MQFLVTVRAVEQARFLGSDEMEVISETQAYLRRHDDHRLVGWWSFAGERAFAMLVEVDTARQLDQMLFQLSSEALVTFEIHAVIEDTSV